MKVLKFGGTSVANPQSLTHVIDIINSSKERQVIVVSALGGITNLLVEMAAKASSGVPNYKAHIDTIETRHLELIEYFVPVTQQSEIISFLKSQLNELEEILESLFTLEEATQKSLSKISSYGEILSSTIIFHILKHQDCKVTLKDARSFLFTHTLNDREVVNHELSAKKIYLTLKKLSALSPMLKRSLMDVCGDIVLHDGIVRAQEYQALKLMSLVLTCPMPALPLTTNT